MRYEALGDIKRILRRHPAITYVNLYFWIDETDKVSAIDRWNVPPQPEPPEGLPSGEVEHPWVDSLFTWLQQESIKFMKKTNRGEVAFAVRVFNKGSYLFQATFKAFREGESDDDVSLDPPDSSAGEGGVRVHGAPTNVALKRLDAARESLSAAQREGPVLSHPMVDLSDLPALDQIEDARVKSLIELTGAHAVFVHGLVLPATKAIVDDLRLVIAYQSTQIDQQRGVINASQEALREAQEDLRNYDLIDKGDKRDKQNRKKMVDNVVTRLSDFGQAYLVSKMGLPPELAPLIPILTSDKQLIAALSAPEVIDMLRDPTERAELAQMLKAVSKIHAARQQEKREAENGGKSEKDADADAEEAPENGHVPPPGSNGSVQTPFDE